MSTSQRLPLIGGTPRRRAILLAVVATMSILLASCGEDEDKYKPGGGYQFPGGKKDEKGQYTQGNPI